MKNIRPDLEQVIARTKAFYQTQQPGALLKIKSIADQKAPSISLTDYQFPQEAEWKRYLDDCFAAKCSMWKNRLHLPDDHIPALGPWYGIAEHSTFLGGKVHYGPDTSWQEPLLQDSCSEWEKLVMSRENDTYCMVIGGISYIKERYGDVFVPQVRGTSCVLEIANSQRGSDFFYDFYEEPEAVHELLAFCEKAIIWYFNEQLDAMGDCLGGTLTGFGEWLPGRAIGQLSEDTTTMISGEMYEEFGRPHTQRIIDHFDAAFMHTHALGERVLPSIAKLKGLNLMELSSDPNTDRAIEVYKRNKEALQGPIPVLNLTRQEIEENMDLLKSQKTIIWYNASCMADAEDMLALIRRELPVKE